MKQVNFRVSDEMYALLAREADRVNQTPSAYAKQKIEYHLTGGNAQIDRLSSSIEQLSDRQRLQSGRPGRRNGGAVGRHRRGIEPGAGGSGGAGESIGGPAQQGILCQPIQKKAIK